MLLYSRSLTNSQAFSRPCKAIPYLSWYCHWLQSYRKSPHEQSRAGDGEGGFEIEVTNVLVARSFDGIAALGIHEEGLSTSELLLELAKISAWAEQRALHLGKPEIPRLLAQGSTHYDGCVLCESCRSKKPPMPKGSLDIRPTLGPLPASRSAELSVKPRRKLSNRVCLYLTTALLRRCSRDDA